LERLAMAVRAVHAARDKRGSSKRGRFNEGVEEGVEGALVLAFACREEQAIGAGRWACGVRAWRTRLGHALAFDAFCRARGG